MARISQVASTIDNAGGSLQVEMIQGEAFDLKFELRDGGVAKDITAYTLTCPIEYFTATADGSLSGFTKDAKADGTLVVSKVDAAQGSFKVVVPSTLWDGSIELDATAGVPAVVAYLTIEDADGQIDIQRIVFVVRRGAVST